MKIKKVISKKVIPPEYKVILTMAGNEYESEGATIDEALASLAIDWVKIKAKGIIKVLKGKQSVERLFQMGQLRRIFVNKIMRSIWAKRLELFLNEQNASGL